jgi:phosphoribosylglycinamide formyltransferase-1
MALSTGSNKIKTAIFISGTGSNLKSLIKFSKLKKSPIIITMIISNNSKAKGLQYSKIYKIKKKVFDFKSALSEKKIIHQLNKNNIDLICLAGFMKILSKSFIKNFKGKILNIHPSLLPKYKGLNTHERAIRNKDKYSGCTVHFVNSRLDSGEIINQKKVRIKKLDTPKTLAKRILFQEHKLYPAAIRKALSL